MKTILTIWKPYTYDVWGNKRDGYEVNDRSGHSEVEIRCRIQTHNPGTPQEFQSTYPSDYALRRIFGTSAWLEVSGDDLTIYVQRASDGYPLGELHCTSHSSLSPIRPLTED